MKAITRYEWKYQPQDFFEEPIDIRLPGLAVYSQNGTVTADVDAEATDNPGFSLGDLTETVINHFRGHQFLSRIPYTLENPTHIEFDESGNRHVFVHAGSGSYRLAGKRAHLNYSGSGERPDRIDKKNTLSSLIESCKSDPVSDRIIRSYEMSIKDPMNELIYLYEVCDALKSHFGGRMEAQEVLNISEQNWDRLHVLANNLPLAQGRHRGNHNNLREATEEEIYEAREITLQMIESYLRHV